MSSEASCLSCLPRCRDGCLALPRRTGEGGGLALTRCTGGWHQRGAGGGGGGANEAHRGGANEAQGGLALTRRAPSPICASCNEARSFSQTLNAEHCRQRAKLQLAWALFTPTSNVGSHSEEVAVTALAAGSTESRTHITLPRIVRHLPQRRTFPNANSTLSTPEPPGQGFGLILNKLDLETWGKGLGPNYSVRPPQSCTACPMLNPSWAASTALQAVKDGVCLGGSKRILKSGRVGIHWPRWT